VWIWLCVSNRNVLLGCVCGGLYCTYFLQVTGGAKFLCGIPLDALVLCRPAFFKLWSSGSALVVLGLTFYEINYPAYIDVLL
jgi:hypothetical protein